MAAPSAGQALRLEEWDHLRIGVREKPLSDEEKARVQVLLKVDADRLIAFYPDSKEGLLYNYDYFFPDDATQTDVYQTVGMEMVELIMNGYSACCLAYGPAGAGKTHTLFGSDQEPGLIQLTTKELLRRIETTPQSLQFSVRLSYWEMSNTEIRDVLSLANTANLPVRKNKNSDGVYIPGLTEVDVTSWAQLDDYVMLGNINQPPSLPDKPYKDIEDAPNVAEEDSHNHQKWKQSVVSSKIHGTRNTIYIPTKGAAPVQGCNTYKGQWKAGHKHGF
eukprot:gene3712-5770_t